MEVWLAPVAGTRVLVPFRFQMPRRRWAMGVLEAHAIRLGTASRAGASAKAVLKTAMTDQRA